MATESAMGAPRSVQSAADPTAGREPAASDRACGVAGGRPPAAGASVLLRDLRSWAGIFSAYLSTHTLTQLLGIAVGILFIRAMPVGEFALYTLAGSVVTFLAFATDLGSTSSLLHFYRRARAEGLDFQPFVQAVASLRRTAFLVGSVVVLAVFPAAALSKGFALLDVALVSAALLLAVIVQIGASVSLLTLRLENRYAASYRAEVAGAALRLVLATAMLVAALMRSWLGVLSGAAGSALCAWLARRPRDGARRPAEIPAAELQGARRAVLRYLLPTLPSAAYFAVQGPLVVWLAASFGAARHIAEVGALTRLGLLVGIFSGLTGVVFLPRLARIDEEAQWRRMALRFAAVHTALGGALLLAAWLAPRPLLWILGEHYEGLDRELLLVVLGAVLTLLGGYVVSVNLSRSWTRLEVVAVSALAVFQALAIATMELSSSAGVLRFNAWSALVGLLLQLAITTLGILRPRWVRWA